jgi:hypothetical protein
MRRRWDTDEVGHGIGHGRALIPDLRRLEAALDLPDWIAERPDAHLLPHIRRVVESPASPFDLVGWEIADNVLVVDLRPRQSDARRDDRKAILAIVGAFAEPATFIRERRVGDSFEYDVACGVLEGDGGFGPHGHLVRLRIRGQPG